MDSNEMKLVLKRKRQTRRTEIAGSFSGAMLVPKIGDIELPLAKTSFILAIGLLHASRPELEYFFVQPGKECHRKFEDSRMIHSSVQNYVSRSAA
jgi:hypothetical protein